MYTGTTSMDEFSSSFAETRLHLNNFELIGGYGFETSASRCGFSGLERRVINNPIPLFRGRISKLVLDQYDYRYLVNFFNARRGNAIGFRMPWWADNSCTNSEKNVGFNGVTKNVGVTLPAVGDGNRRAFQLCKKYVDGDGETIKPLFKIVPDTVEVYIDQLIDNYAEVDLTTGRIVTSYVPANRAIITHKCHFDLPVRFDINYLPAFIESQDEVTGQQIYTFEDIPVKEILFPIDNEPVGRSGGVIWKM